MTRLPSPLLFVADAAHAPSGLPGLVASAVGAGVSFVEIRRVRDAEPHSRERLAEIEACLAAAAGVTVIVNDRVDLAILAHAAGAHVGQDDMSAADARRLLGPGALLGLSTHDERQFEAAQDLPIDYVALGPIFLSRTKSGHAEPVGIDRLAACCRVSKLPVVAIGGIDAATASAVRGAGADAVAVASALAVGDVAANARALLAAVGDALGPAGTSAARGTAGHWFIAGLSGSGKSTVGPRLARRAGRAFVDLDAEVARRAGVDVADLIEQRGETGFRELEVAALGDLIRGSRQPLVLALGGGTLLSEAARRLMAERGLILWLDVPVATCVDRTRRSAVRRPLLAAALAGGEARVAAFIGERADLAGMPTLRVDGRGNADAVAESAFALLSPLSRLDQGRPAPRRPLS